MNSFKTRPGRRGNLGKWETHDCAFLEPEALPPDLPPPVILKVGCFGWFGWKKEVSESGETLRRVEESESVVVMTIARS